MARVTATEVKQIIDTALSDAIVDVFITAANLLVTKLLESSNLSTAHLKEIERLLSAHFVALRDPREMEVSIGEVRTRYEGSAGMGLDRSRYGQQVKLLDTTGAFVNAGKLAAAFTVISEED